MQLERCKSENQLTEWIFDDKNIKLYTFTISVWSQ